MEKGMRLTARPLGGLEPLTYLGLMVSGFPNMFVVTGPAARA